MTQPSALLRLPLAAAIAIAAAHSYAATVIVDSNDDDMATTSCNLRGAITAINNGSFANAPHCSNASSDPFGTNDTINFAPALANSTILLTQGVLQLSLLVHGVTINGSGQVLDAQNSSGVLSLVSSKLTADNLTFTHGNAPYHAAYPSGGGGIYANASSLTLDHCLLESNTAAAGSYSGAMYLLNSGATLTNSTISNNTLASCGTCSAGILSVSSALKLVGSTVSGNQATGFRGISGGLYAIVGSVWLYDSTVSGNSAAGNYVAGGLLTRGATAFLVNSTVADNSATGDDVIAGGIGEGHYDTTTYSSSGITLTNTTVSSNHASNPAGTATHIAGGIVLGTFSGVFKATTSTMTLANTIVSGNETNINGTTAKSDIGLGVPTNAPTTSVSHSLLGSALAASYAGNGNQFSDTPHLAALRNYGGNTETMAPLSGSAAIDAGDNTLAIDALSNPLTTDQTGALRVVNSIVDIGAVEYTGDEIFTDGFNF